MSSKGRLILKMKNVTTSARLVNGLPAHEADEMVYQHMDATSIPTLEAVFYEMTCP
jgi:hypothetical protein